MTSVAAGIDFLSVLEAPASPLVRGHGPDLIREAGIACRHLAVVPPYHRRRAGEDHRPLPVLLPGRAFFLRPALLPGLATALPLLVAHLGRGPASILHCRSYPAMLLGSWAARLCRGVRLVFDPRGLYPYEGVVAGRWREGSSAFRWWLEREALLCRAADMVISVCPVFGDHYRPLAGDGKLCEIPLGTPVNRHLAGRGALRAELGWTGRLVAAYAGSLGVWHDPALLVDLYRALRGLHPRPLLLVLSASPADSVTAAWAAAGLPAGELQIRSTNQDGVARHLAAADLGLLPGNNRMPAAILRTMFATKSSEYLAAGLPVVYNRQIRGSGEFLERHGLGRAFETEPSGGIGLCFNRNALLADREGVAAAAILVHREHLSRDVAASRLQELYRRLETERAPIVR